MSDLPIVSVDLVASLPPSGSWLELTGGLPGGKDDVHKTVSGWAGWRRMPGASRTGTSVYRAAAWPAALLPLQRTRKLAVRWTPAAQAFKDASLDGLRGARLALDAAPDPGASWSAINGGRLLMTHQRQAARAIRHLGTGVLFDDDMGLGKTTSAIFLAREATRLLVVCPKSAKLNWVEEIYKCYGFNEYVELDNGEVQAVSNHGQGKPNGPPFIYLIDGSQKQRLNTLEYMRFAIRTGLRAVAIVNYDLLRSMNAESWQTMEAWVFGQALVADEFHYCKDLSSKRSQGVQALAAKAIFRLGMTGTPIRNLVDDLYAQIEILRPGTFVSYHDFANRHVVQSLVSFNGSKKKTPVVRGGKNLDELNEILNTMRVGRKKEEVLTLPPKIQTKVRLELDGVHLEVYDAMKTMARLELEKLAPEVLDGNVFHPAAKSAVELAMRCEMLAQGFISGLPPIYADRMAPLIKDHAQRIEGIDNAFVFPSSNKLAWILEKIEELKSHGRQVGIMSRFNAPLYWMHRSGMFNSSILTGELSAEDRQRQIRLFSEKTTQVFLCQVKLAEAFNLQVCTDMIFIGRDWSPALNRQAEARFHRIGTQGTVNIQIPYVVNSVERLLDRKLEAKEADAQQALSTTTVRELLASL